MKDNHTEQYAGNSIPNVAPSHTIVFTSHQIFIYIKCALPVLAQISIAVFSFKPISSATPRLVLEVSPKAVN